MGGLKIRKQTTYREWGLDKYLQEIWKKKILTDEQEIALVRRIKQWDKVALDILVQANLRFVVSVAKQYQSKQNPLPDLINEGNIWLIKAAQRFDETRWFKFISYAVYWILQSIKASIPQEQLVKLPLNKVWDRHRVMRIEERLFLTLQRPPTDEEIYDEFKIRYPEKFNYEDSVAPKTGKQRKSTLTVDKIHFLRMFSPKHISLDAPISDTEDLTFMESSIVLDSLPQQHPTDHLTLASSVRFEVERLLSFIWTDIDRKVIQMYYGLHPYERTYTLIEIENELWISRETARQKKEKLLRWLKHKGKKYIDKDF